MKTFKDERAPSDAELENRHTFHEKPNELQIQHYNAIRAKYLELAKYVRDHTPCTREQSLALTHLEESQFFAICGISRNPQRFDAEAIEVNINGRNHMISTPWLTYEDIAALVPDQPSPTVCWKQGQQHGLLVRGERLPVQQGLYIDAMHTGSA